MIDVRLGVDPRKANQMVRGVVSLPHGTGKQTRYWYFVLPIRKLMLKPPVPTMLVLDEYIEKIKGVGLILT